MPNQNKQEESSIEIYKSVDPTSSITIRNDSASFWLLKNSATFSDTSIKLNGTQRRLYSSYQAILSYLQTLKRMYYEVILLHTE